MPMEEFDRGNSLFKTAQTFYNNFKIVQEGDYRTSLPIYCNAIKHFESALDKKHPETQQKIDECLRHADPKTWGLQGMPDGIDQTEFPESLKMYLEKQKKLEVTAHAAMPPLPLNLIEERTRRNSAVRSPKTPPSASGEKSAINSSTTERSDGSSDGESGGRSLRKQISKFILGKQSPLRTSSVEKERPISCSPEKHTPLEKSQRTKNLKKLMQDELAESVPSTQNASEKK
jgi:CRISPR/Cas system Type II protein with McrA/HNH and RuvC-like nuclease domain